MLIDEGAVILERLRIARGFNSQEKFVDDICDVRQYQRYLSGVSSMPSEIFISLIARLNMSIEEVLKFYLDTTKKEKKIVQSLYNRLLSDQLEGIDILIKDLNQSIFIERTDRILFTFCTYLYDYKNKRLLKTDFIDRVKDLIDFDRLMSFEIISIYEMLILSNINTDLNPTDRQLVIDKLSKALKSYEINDLSSLDYYLIIMYTVIRIHGTDNKLSEAIDLCNLGVSLSSQYHHFYLLAHLYYLKAYYFQKLDNTIERDENIHLSIVTLEIGLKNQLTTKIRRLIEQEFDINIFDFEIGYWENKKRTVPVTPYAHLSTRSSQ